MDKSEAARSYDAVTRSKKSDMDSQRTPFRHYNNFIKKKLIQFSLDHVHEKRGATEASVLDLACGRGGDLGKWIFSESPAINARPRWGPPVQATRVGYYRGFDVSAECVAESQRRLTQMEKKCDAAFTVADCFSSNFLKDVLPSERGYGSFDVVSIQFAFHYACGSLESVDNLLKAVAMALREGGALIITTVDPTALEQKMGTNQRSYTGALFQVELGEADTPLGPCSKYVFRLEGFVDCPEYVVPTAYVLERCEAYGLTKVDRLSVNFSEFLSEYNNNPRINKGNVLSAEDLDLVTLYQTLCFLKD